MAHEVTADGESTANWHCQKGSFWGTVNQVLVCARCGGTESKRHDEPRKYRDVLKPTFHLICDPCHEELPE